MSYLLEVCADSVRSAVEAQAGGADRIELCSGLVIGGLSPSVAMFEQVKKNVDIPVRVLLRPRFGDFCYDGYEFETLKEEVCLFREAGADGVVIGILKPDGRLDTDRMKELVECAKSESKSGKRPCAVTFHRAFDVCRSPYEALRQCIELGIDTILTSGQKDSAWNGRELLIELVIDEVMFGPQNIGMTKGQAKEKAVAALKLVGLEQLADFER